MLKAGTSIISSLKRVLCREADDVDFKEKQLILSFYDRSRLRQFKQVIDDTVVRSFLQFDQCYLLADNYLIAMVLVYFLRSNLLTSYYDARHFFSALYLAHEMEEDLEKLKEFIVPWFPWPIKERKFAVLNEIKYLLWVNMNHECLVSRNDCDEIMKETSHWLVWSRTRDNVHHINSIRTRVFKRCCGPMLVKALYLERRSSLYKIEDDIIVNTSDWEVESSPPDIDTNN